MTRSGGLAMTVENSLMNQTTTVASSRKASSMPKMEPGVEEAESKHLQRRKETM